MSDLTIEQLEALREETTPGPWEVGATTDLGHVYVGASNPDVGGIIAETGHNDAPLIAAAPALVDALIAEKKAHQKLRDEMGELVEYLSIQEGYDRPSRFFVHGQQSAMDLIKDILGGDNG